ncbi:hypothetical protein AGOR_G00110580 [Albula goreensis]|uniref:CNH domain-containing protein n=1 Tax=Albula goreensis TaxID=1534307 RepID=A0A8T3DLB9_9TELE|nr:hypothetical protein AGOR_G00110580 [Albula goreensis]
MSLQAFIPTLILEKPASGKEKDKSSIQCLEACGRNLYIGGKDSLIQHLILPVASGQETKEKCTGIRETRKRQLGSRSPVSQLGAIPFLNHLLVLCDGSLSAFNMFSLESLPALRKIRNVAFFRLRGADAMPDSSAPVSELFTASPRRRTVNVHAVSVDRWECLREVALPQEPLALAVDGSCLCVATGDRYLLKDHEGAAPLELFPHDSSKQSVIVETAGKGEFLLQGPGSLGMFVTRSGVSGRPPVQWLDGILAARVHFPYVLTLSSEALCIYSMLDQRIKQTIPLRGAKGLLSTPEAVFVFTEKEVHSLSPVPLVDQISALVANERVDEALDFIQGVKSLLSKDTYKALYKNLTCTAGFVKFYQENFSEAKDLFIKGNMDPREIISLYPELSPTCEDFKSQHAAVFNAKDIRALREDHATFQQYLSFLADFLRAVRGTEQSCGCHQDVDEALLKLYAKRGEEGDLVDLLSNPNDCVLSTCVPCLEHYKRFFALGLLYQSHGQDYNAIQIWVNIVDGDEPGNAKHSAYENIIDLLRRQKGGQLVWKFADWALHKSQEVGVQIFSGREKDQDELGEEEVLSFLNKYPQALVLYLENLVHALKSKKEKHHTLLAKMYVEQSLQEMEKGEDVDATINSTREKLQQFLRESSLYSTAALHERIRGTGLHVERAILHGVAGEHRKALNVLVHEEKDLQAAEDYCRTALRGLPEEFRRPLYHALLGIYLDSPQLATAAADLLNRNAAAFDPVAALRTLPGAWSVPLVSRFLCESVRGLIHRGKMAGVERNLAKVEHFRNKCTRAVVTRGMVKLERGRICQRCGRYLTEPEFMRSLRGELIHTHCWGREPPPTVL